MSDAATHVFQVLRELELLLDAWCQCQQQPHQQDVPEARTVAQSCCNAVEHNGRHNGGPPQDDPVFCFRSRLTSPASATCTHHSNVAPATVSHHIHAHDSGDASNDANDANNTLSGHQPHGSAVWTSHPCCRAACSGSHTSCRHDDALLRTVPTASPLLMGRGE